MPRSREDTDSPCVVSIPVYIPTRKRAALILRPSTRLGYRRTGHRSPNSSRFRYPSPRQFDARGFLRCMKATSVIDFERLRREEAFIHLLWLAWATKQMLSSAARLGSTIACDSSEPPPTTSFRHTPICLAWLERLVPHRQSSEKLLVYRQKYRQQAVSVPRHQ